MEIFSIKGPNKISGTVKISGSKNSALPILISSLLSKKKITLKNIPDIEDINILLKIFKLIGVKINKNKHLNINAKNIKNIPYPCKLINKIRASIWLPCVLIKKFRKIKIDLPGGCKIGERPIDLHLNVYNRLGIKFKKKKKYIKIFLKKKLHGNIIKFPKISVGATITAILISILIDKNITIVNNISIEPEVIDTINFLNKIGAKIIKVKKRKIKIIGVKKLNKGTYKIISDRIEAGTFLIASVILKSKITCLNINPKILKSILKKLKSSGANIKTGKNYITINMIKRKIKPINISTAPYPGIPTDIQAQFTVLNSIAKGKSTIKENIFKNRFNHVPELIRMGAKIKINKNVLICKGIKKLKNANITAKDLRSSASLILAATIAHGRTIIKNIQYIHRGYENIIKKFTKLGIEIKKKINEY